MTILDGLPDPIFVVDGLGRVVYLNAACESAFGEATGRAKGQPVREALGASLDEGLLALLSPAPPREATPASLVSVRIGSGYWDVRVTRGSHDLTAVYCVPSSPHQSGWPDLVADSADAIWALDDNEHIAAWNRGAEEMFGYTSQEVIGKPITVLIPKDLIAEREPERLRKALRELGAVRDYQTRRLAKDGREVEVSLTRTVTRNGQRNSSGLASLTIVRDLSQRRQVERQVIESEKLVTLGQLAASVAQEIGAPLTSIGIVVENLRRGLGDPDAERQLEMAAQQLSRIARLTHGLVELAKPGELHLTQVQVADVIDRVLELLAPSLERARVQVAVKVDPDTTLPEILADAGQLQQVFLNLLMNAERAMGPRGGGSVTIAAELTRGFPVVGRPMRQVIKVEVSDDGPGIEPADLHYIFAPFFSRSGGSGLGLALAKQIIHAHGGAIEARSSLGQGATFTVILPVESDA
ncbi:MAG TPA: PAS domain S-box protein [Gemmatimonadota bacterium]|nr:PAS domain S-box protein [Gemmatimonadota bacterium]